MLPIPLRVLLCISLVLNGSGPATASVQMQMAHAKPSCHEQPDAGTSAAAAELPDATPDPTPSKPPLPDCCKSGACSGACMQSSQGVIPLQALPRTMRTHVDSLGRQKPEHAAPALPHLIRPPIR